MGEIIADISMSLDGFVTGPDPAPERGLGRGGEAIHEWVFGGNPVDTAVLDETVTRTGTVVMGKRTYEVVAGPNGWTDAHGYGQDRSANPPVVVVTHQRPDPADTPPRFSFITGGVEDAIAKARALADGNDVMVIGGGTIVRECLRLRLLDELRVHLAPVVLGRGTPLFTPGATRARLEQVRVRASAKATHIVYRVLGG